jgi:holo-[acyl-carrier protein] synthase
LEIPCVTGRKGCEKEIRGYSWPVRSGYPVQCSAMIYGIGVDLVNITRMGRAIERWGNRFITRIFTPREIDFCAQGPRSVSRFSLRFAAKEAFSKALGLGMRRGIRWRDIEVFHHPSGRPDLVVAGKARMVCHQEGISRWHLTLSDEAGYGIAVVVLEKHISEDVKQGEKGPSG